VDTAVDGLQGKPYGLVTPSLNHCNYQARLMERDILSQNPAKAGVKGEKYLIIPLSNNLTALWRCWMLNVSGASVHW